eukprot:TRINITY_DN63710_c0_g1_i1.p1 TRINITY_DN63710_c0_g1~~TRINITY_DN63710_c0_g1_i1.p1  ORF type:complete len:342 (-),score=59.06 TRINITY_DN63710_c0_g1_i1:216-1217(-)
MQSWREGLEIGAQPTGLQNMRRWQAAWVTPCARLCCFSPDCARQSCCACGKSISRNCGDRAVCMKCDLKFADPGDATCHDVIGYQLCATCFSDSDVLHNHENFCFIRGVDGNHSGVRRDCGLAQCFEYTESMCVTAPPLAEGTNCKICYCPFDDAADPASSWPGCTACPPHYVDTRKDLKQPSGVTLGGGYAHRSCIMMWIQSKGLTYCAVDSAVPPPTICPHCEWDVEACQWQREFSPATAMIADELGGGKSPLDGPSTEALFRRIAASVEVALVSLETAEAAAPVTLERALALLKDAVAERHPQVAVHRIMEELCDDVVEMRVKAVMLTTC